MPYVQQSVDLLKILPQLATGARCVVFTCIGLFDADPLGASKRDILDYTGLSRPTVESALRFLEKEDLVHFTPKTRRYRPNPQFVSFRGNQKAEVRELAPILQGEPAFMSNCKKVFYNPEEEEVPGPSSRKDLLLLPAREILARAGLYGKDLDGYSKQVSPELADRWARWIAYARANLNEPSPAGICNYRLKQDPTAEPPNMAAVEEWERQIADQNGRSPDLAEDSVSDNVDTPLSMQPDRAGDIWRAVLKELQLQTTKPVFDTWLRSTHALALTDDTLVVGVPSPYAKEWLENRLHVTIRRTVAGIVGYSVQVRYEMNGHGQKQQDHDGNQCHRGARAD